MKKSGVRNLLPGMLLWWSIRCFACVLAFGIVVSGGGLFAQDRIGERVPNSKSEIHLSFAPVVKKAAPAVVNVYVRRRVQQRISPIFNDPFFKRFFGQEFGVPRSRVENSLGSGVIVSPDGVVVTNFHVIKGGADTDIKVALADKREFSARVVLRDKRTDLAVLKIDNRGKTFPFIDFEDSDGLEVGDLVLAIGNPFGVGQTVTSGIVSALARTRVGISNYQFFIQTDAAINPGNSGGALVDVHGRLVGINTAIFTKSGGSNGIGFAIPSNMVRLVVDSAMKGSKVARPWFGARLQRVTADIADSLGLDRPVGALIGSITKDSPAHRGGLRPGDVIIGIDDQDVTDPGSFHYRFSTKPFGSKIELTVVRKRRVREVVVESMAAPEIVPRNISLLRGRHPFDGAKIGNLSPAFAEELSLEITSGVIILDVSFGSRARRVGLRRGDIVMKINGQNIDTVRTMGRVLNQPRNAWRLRIRRGKRVFDTVVRG